ncbi:uncharacterized protein SPPG_04055 [Spizellomyces punctatus DAOM BR117]|uniref:Uncharacterized protein n=1 Tax=Spizellomyces punctatus (strain DAOM BR117) TaxID=645134 RepID=A0A0L0HJ78_SPIPD|nr:uncharacterized protein SPPG_04055 [Spizellomyces punctatus DAOM BR117]KND00955.1 hypothetical protein SPPG_04055 [Spizellomyces punctatus DAOM BR117]|eukprot:XP_016608994.1 hypothetical protein SPPG_04055 [Spizellomyces punctatus DAOM BR117]
MASTTPPAAPVSAPASSQDNGDSNIVIIVAGVTAAAALLITIIIVSAWIYIKRERAKQAAWWAHRDMLQQDSTPMSGLYGKPRSDHLFPPPPIDYLTPLPHGPPNMARRESRASTVRNVASERASLGRSSVKSLARQARQGDEAARAELASRFQTVSSLMGLTSFPESDPDITNPSNTVLSFLESAATVPRSNLEYTPSSLSRTTPAPALRRSGSRMSKKSSSSRPHAASPFTRSPSVSSNKGSAISYEDARMVAEAFLRDIQESTARVQAWDDRGSVRTGHSTADVAGSNCDWGDGGTTVEGDEPVAHLTKE